MLELHHPGFACPICRTFADLEADVEIDEQELKAISDALDEAEAVDGPPLDPTGSNALLNSFSKRQGAGTAEDAIEVDSDDNLNMPLLPPTSITQNEPTVPQSHRLAPSRTRRRHL